MRSSLLRLLVTEAARCRLMASPALALALLATAPQTSWAQTVVGGSNRPNVEVNLGVLDSLGPAPTLPDLLRDGEPKGSASLGAQGKQQTASKTGLHPPKAKKKKAAAVAAKKSRGSEQKGEQQAALNTKAAATPAASAAASTAPPREGAAPATSPTAPAPAPVATNASPAPAATGVASATPTSPASAPPPASIPTANPSAAAVTAMNTPPTIAAPPSTPAQLPVTPAAAPAVVGSASGSSSRVIFAASATDLPESAKRDLDALVQKLTASEQQRIQLVAYAAGATDDANQARRVSLSRAIAVRSYLIEHGVRSSRMDVRALGNRSDNGDPPDRVDIVMVER